MPKLHRTEMGTGPESRLKQSGKNSKGIFWTEGVVTGEAGSLVRLTGPYTNETYTTFLGKLTVNAVNAFNKKETVLYVKDGVINTSARQAFAAAYVWDEEKSDYVQVPNDIYKAGDAGLGGHIEGSGEIRVGTLGFALTIR